MAPLKPGIGTDEGKDLIDYHTSALSYDILGHCIFCSKAIIKNEYNGNEKMPNVDYALQVVKVKFPGTEKVHIKRENVFLYHTDCIKESLFRVAFLKSIVEINIDFKDLNDSYLKLMQKEAIETKHKQKLEEELKTLAEDPDNEVAKRVDASRETEEDVRNA